jgi:hypothetical protein
VQDFLREMPSVLVLEPVETLVRHIRHKIRDNQLRTNALEEMPMVI